MVSMYKKDKLRLLVGMVEQVRFEDADNGARTAVVRLKDKNADRVDIYFKNDLSSPENPKKLADRVELAKVEAGKWLSILVLMESDTAATATGLDFKYKGRWHFKLDEGKEANVMVGYSIRPERVKSDLFKISMAEDIYNKDTKASEPKWYRISFFDDDKSLLSKKAETLLAVEGKKSVLCAIRCSAIKDTEVDGKVYHNMTGYRVETMVSAEAAA